MTLAPDLFHNRAQRAGEWMATPADGNTRQFIQLEQRFVHQFAKYAAAFPHLKEYAAREKMRLSADLLLSCSPDSISLQLSNEGSIFYTVRKYDITIYFDHYLCEQYDGRDETLITVFKKDDKILELAGTLEATALKLSTILASESISFPTFA